MSTQETEEKVTYLRELLRTRPRITIQQARTAIKERFGSTLNTHDLNRSVKTIRQELDTEHLEPQLLAVGPPGTPSFKEVIFYFRAAMAMFGISNVKLLEDGEVELKMR